MTPQFIYYVIPIAALLSVLVTFGLLARSSELSVMKACGISLYRVGASLLVLSLVLERHPVRPRAAHHGAAPTEQAEALDAEIRGRPPQTSNPLQPPLGGRPRTARSITTASSIRSGTRCSAWRSTSRARIGWALESQTFVRRAVFRGKACGRRRTAGSRTSPPTPPTWAAIRAAAAAGHGAAGLLRDGAADRRDDDGRAS